MRLPVEEIRSDLLEPFMKGSFSRTLLKAPTGSGKSTSVPSMLLDNGIEGLVVVIQPRRIAARMLASRVAQLRGSSLGQEVGYVVRFDRRMCGTTRIVYLTDGIFQNWLDENPKLDGIGAVVFDEFHERRVASDVSLATCLKLQEGERSDLQLVVMSATLEMGGLTDYMSPCRELEAKGRTFPVEISYQAPVIATRGGGQYQQREGIWDHCFKAASEAITSPDCGHILIFLPGVYEINRTMRLLEDSSRFKGWNICPLYSALNPKLQDEAVRSSKQPKIIVSTNVAETSLTIDGVRTVIDAGLGRVAEFDANRALETLMVKPISQASADQRAGRAGRTSTGRAIRLWSQTSHAKRAEFELPEIKRVDVADLMLRLLAKGESVKTFHWLDAPDEKSVQQAELTLKFLEALDSDGELTKLGATMARLPLSPRLSRLILAGEEEGCLAEACFIASAMQAEGIFSKNRAEAGRADFLYDDDGSDFAGEFRAYETAKSLDFEVRRCANLGIMARGSKECHQSLKQIKQQVERLGLIVPAVDFENRKDGVSLAAVKAFGDRLGSRLNKSTLASRLVDGRKGQLDSESVVKSQEMFLPTEITEVGGKDVVVHLNRCIGVDLEILKKSCPEHFLEQDSVVYDADTRRVERRLLTQFKGLTIQSVSGGEPDGELAAALLAEKVASGDLVLKNWDKTVERWIARLLGLRQWMPELELPGFDEQDRALALEQVCYGAVSYKEIKNREVIGAVRSWLSSGQQAAMDAYAPKEIKLSNGRSTKVYYEVGKTPWIAMRAQLLFGVNETPTIANGAVKLNVHICAPNNRPWQITDDLAGFWKRGFEQMRKDLGGRYPKHQWTLD